MSNPIELSQELYRKVRGKKSTSDIRRELAALDIACLTQELSSDDLKKAFWLNLYNAYSILLLSHNADVITTFRGRQIHFRRKAISIAGKKLSLNDIEHGMLRRRKGLVFKKLIVSKFEKQFRLSALDYRIHFALNCGGMSCPPIRYYRAERVNEQLDVATKSFLHTEAKYSEGENSVRLSRLFQWYKGDFGGKTGVLAVLKRYGVIPSESKPSLIFDQYNWTPDLDAFES